MNANRDGPDAEPSGESAAVGDAGREPDDSLLVLIRALKLLERVDRDSLGPKAARRVLNALEELDNAVLHGAESIACDRAGGELVCDGGIPRRDAMKAVGGMVGLGTLSKGAGAIDDGGGAGTGSAGGRQPTVRSNITAHAYVPLPREAWTAAVKRAARSGEVDGLDSKLLDYVYFQFAFTVDGEVVHANDGFDPNKVVGPAGEPVVDLASVDGEARGRQ